MPFKVIGMPSYSFFRFIILYLASLNMPQNRKIAKEKIAKGVWVREKPKIAGATPKDIVSARESSSLPKAFCCPNFLASFPSA